MKSLRRASSRAQLQKKINTENYGSRNSSGTGALCRSEASFFSCQFSAVLLNVIQLDLNATKEDWALAMQ